MPFYKTEDFITGLLKLDHLLEGVLMPHSNMEVWDLVCYRLLHSNFGMESLEILCPTELLLSPLADKGIQLHLAVDQLTFGVELTFPT